MAKRILVPFDLSEYSLDASNEAIELAKLFGGGSGITFVHVLEPNPYQAYSDVLYDTSEAERAVEDEIVAKVNEWFSQVAERCDSNNVPSTMDILFGRGSITKAIADYAKNMSADLIVIGHSSIHGVGKWLKGDVAKGVIDHAYLLLVLYWLLKGSSISSSIAEQF